MIHVMFFHVSFIPTFIRYTLENLSELDSLNRVVGVGWGNSMGDIYRTYVKLRCGVIVWSLASLLNLTIIQNAGI